MNPWFCGQLSFNKGAKTNQWENNSPFNKWCCNNWIATCKRMKLDHYLTLYAKITQNGSDINGRDDSTKLLEENIRVYLHDLGFGNKFQDLTPKA